MTANEKANPLIFGEYKLLKKLGSGGAASVYLAERTGARGFTKRLALKRTHEHYQSHKVFVDQFVSEARLGGFLTHSNIVEVFDFGEVSGCAYIAMEYVNGPSLEWLIHRCRKAQVPIPESIVLDIAIAACEALAYAHSARDYDGQPLNIVHRDVKPSNLMLSIHGEVKLADFGVARAASNVVQTAVVGIVKGTVRYMSPEQTSGSLKTDARSDLYSLALIIYELLAGQPMYQGAGQIAILGQAMRGRTERSVAELAELGCHEAWVALLNLALQNQPNRRVSNAREMLIGLRQLQRLIPISGDLASFIGQMGYADHPHGESRSHSGSVDPVKEETLANLSLASAEDQVPASVVDLGNTCVKPSFDREIEALKDVYRSDELERTETLEKADTVRITRAEEGIEDAEFQCTQRAENLADITHYALQLPREVDTEAQHGDQSIGEDANDIEVLQPEDRLDLVPRESGTYLLVSDTQDAIDEVAFFVDLPRSDDSARHEAAPIISIEQDRSDLVVPLYGRRRFAGALLLVPLAMMMAFMSNRLDWDDVDKTLVQHVSEMQEEPLQVRESETSMLPEEPAHEQVDSDVVSNLVEPIKALKEEDAAIGEGTPVAAPESTANSDRKTRVSNTLKPGRDSGKVGKSNPNQKSEQRDPSEPVSEAPAARATGRLTLNSRPITQVSIDGQKIGSIPVRKLDLTAGEHDVVLRRDGKVVLRKTIYVRDDKSLTCFADVKTKAWKCR